MGDYTSNYNLYKPEKGETGWGEKVNDNFDILDQVLKQLDEDLKKKLFMWMMKAAKVKALYTRDIYLKACQIVKGWEI